MMTNDIQTLIPILLSNFVTVRFPRISPELDPLQLRSDSQWERVKRDFRHDRLLCEMRQTAFRIALGEAGYRRFLDPTEGWLSGECRIHFFFADHGAVSMVSQMNMGIVGAGDPVGINTVEYLKRRLQRLKSQNRLMSGDRWWDFDEP